MKMKKILALMISLSMMMSFIVPVSAQSYGITVLETGAFEPVNTSSGWTEVTDINGVTTQDNDFSTTTTVKDVNNFVMTFDMNFYGTIEQGKINIGPSIKMQTGTEYIWIFPGWSDNGATIEVKSGDNWSSDHNEDGCVMPVTYNFKRTLSGNQYTVPSKKVYLEKIGTTLKLAIYDSTDNTLEFAGSSTVPANTGNDVLVQRLLCPVTFENVRFWKEGVILTPTPTPTPVPTATPSTDQW